LTHSQIVKARIPVGAIAALAFLGNERGPLDAVAHGATLFTGNASHREKQNADRADYQGGVRPWTEHAQSIPAIAEIVG
jgi:hypothetical protein